jgi:thiamine transport system substrate-binding protein
VLEGGSFRQIEFVGILRGGRERDLAQRFIDFLLSPAFQSDIPLQMWVYPASVKAPLPDIFRAFAAIPSKPAVLEAQVIDARREEWIRKWTRIVLK